MLVDEPDSIRHADEISLSSGVFYSPEQPIEAEEPSIRGALIVLFVAAVLAFAVLIFVLTKLFDWLWSLTGPASG